MFAIYNINGRQFRDSLEQLKKVQPPQVVHPSQIKQDIAHDETVIISGTAEENPVSKQGLQAYEALLNLNPRSHITHVYQLMSHPVMTVFSNAPIETLVDLFNVHNFAQIPVLSPQHKLIGVVEQKAFWKKLYNDQLQGLGRSALDSFMQVEVISADPVTEVRRAAQVMMEYRLSGLPISNEHDQLVGILTRSDLVKALSNDPPISLWT